MRTDWPRESNIFTTTRESALQDCKPPVSGREIARGFAEDDADSGRFRREAEAGVDELGECGVRLAAERGGKGADVDADESGYN
ncbi:MAG: hypothetical protein JO022_10665 [Acidobacteriaceae bacterium]|nr:hypothetical protein [Acidobacteriaceae bacterium]